jgi:Fe-S cluster assembly scaffold protein SufB
VHVTFAGPGGEATLDGLYVTSGSGLVDHHTTADHAVPGCTSRELFKGVLAGASRAVFNGAVIIRPDAQKSDAGQQNQNLLLSEDATIDTKPELQIFADDVKCAHGATVGQLDEAALFYLRARGIGPLEARAILTHAFAREVGRADPARRSARGRRRAGRGTHGEPAMSLDQKALNVMRLRADFPILGSRVHGKPLVYLDNAARRRSRARCSTPSAATTRP